MFSWKFRKIHKKHLCHSFNKTGVFLGIFWNLLEHLFYRTSLVPASHREKYLRSYCQHIKEDILYKELLRTAVSEEFCECSLHSFPLRKKPLYMKIQYHKIKHANVFVEMLDLYTWLGARKYPNQKTGNKLKDCAIVQRNFLYISSLVFELRVRKTQFALHFDNFTEHFLIFVKFANQSLIVKLSFNFKHK